MSKQDVLSRKLRLSLNPDLINKNESGDDSLFKTGWINQKLTPGELAGEINKGIAYTCELSGHRNARNFVCCDVLSVDIDGTRTMEDAKSDPFVGRYLTIFYTTPNHTPQIHRFRLVFALPRSIETPQEMRAAYRSLALRLGGDRSATDPARIFFGSKGSKPEVFDRGIADEILDELIAHGLESDQHDKPLSGYGFFESNITTHYEFDQQIWRVRQPGAVKVWINPRRFSFETSREVVKREIRQKHLFRSVLSDYDDDLTPQYHTDDPLIDMAVLAKSQELMSKNNLKQNFIAMKRRHGHLIEFVDRDDGLASEGSALEAEGRYAADAKYRSRLFDAKTLNQDEFEDIELRIQENEDVSAIERVAFARK